MPDLNHHVFLMDRGGQRRLGEITDLTQVQWGRTRDATSTASIAISPKSASNQVDLLNSIMPGRHELAIFRSDGAGSRVWEGPANIPKFTGGQVTVSANDVSQYLLRTVVKNALSYAAPNQGYATAYLMALFRAELAHKESLGYNLLSYLVEHHQDTDAMTTKSVLPGASTVFGVLSDLSSSGGVDFTVLGRAIHLWDVSEPVFGRTRTATEADFLGEVDVSLYGSELVTAAWVTDSQGGAASAGGDDPYYGEWEVLAAPYAGNTDPTAAVPTLADLQSQAERDLVGGNPTPMQVSVPDNSGVVLGGAIELEDLVPGKYIPLRATLSIKQVTQIQKLKSMQVTETAKGETITVSLYPASAPDEEDDGE